MSHDFCPHCGTPPDGDMGQDDCCWRAERDALTARVKELEDRIARALVVLVPGRGFAARRILRGEDGEG